MKIRLAFGAILVLVLGYIAATPYVIAYQIKTAAENQDGEALSEHVDFPALRQNLKDQLNIMIGKEAVKEASENDAFAALGAAFGGILVEKMVDAYVTPAGITALMQGSKPESDTSGGDSREQSRSEPFSNATMSYESFSKFSIKTKDIESGEEVKFVLRRRGLDWKLTEIMLPL